jgi:hypothetical protein
LQGLLGQRFRVSVWSHHGSLAADRDGRRHLLPQGRETIALLTVLTVGTLQIGYLPRAGKYAPLSLRGSAAFAASRGRIPLVTPLLRRRGLPPDPLANPLRTATRAGIAPGT